MGSGCVMGATFSKHVHSPDSGMYVLQHYTQAFFKEKKVLAG